MKELLSFVIYYSLFHKKLSDDDDNDKIIKQIPKNAFGVFTSIRRFTKIPKWPSDIHGCIGYWDKQFNKLTPKELYDNLLRVSYDAVWNDSRNQYFTPIETDPLSHIEIDFMMKPIYKIDRITGIITTLNQQFTNTEFGIIIQTKDVSGTRKATYLPNVFPKISWTKLLESIKDKAGISQLENDFEVFAYRIKQFKTQFINLLIDKIFSYMNIYNFSRFLIDTMKPTLEYPFVYSCRNNILEWNSKDDVRNIATMGDIIKYSSLSNIITKDEIKILQQKINAILSSLDYSSQALSFLGHTINKNNQTKNNNNKIKDKYCAKLLGDLPNAEEEFEKQEIIIGLRKTGCIIKSEKEILQSLIYDSNDTIFRMNWIIQAICSFDMKPSKNLIEILKNKTIEMFTNMENVETNYIAVAFEALCFVYKANKEKQILILIFRLLFELEKRKKCYNVLYAFLDDGARVDITGHINNGLFLFTF